MSDYSLNNRLNIAQVLLPQDCLLCGRATGDLMVCSACDLRLPYHDQPACPQCALPTIDSAVCGRCLKDPPAFDRTTAALDYRYPIVELLYAFKYRGQLAIGGFFSKVLQAKIQMERWPDVIVPMPLHPLRLRKRGFNQAAEIARSIVDKTGLPFSLSALHKTRDTLHQVDLPWNERHTNVKGAFTCDETFAGMRVAIVDDVITTGASMHEAAKAIKIAGAVEVAAWVLARTLPDSDSQ